MENFATVVRAANYCYKDLRLRCLWRTWLRTWKPISNKSTKVLTLSRNHTSFILKRLKTKLSFLQILILFLLTLFPGLTFLVQHHRFNKLQIFVINCSQYPILVKHKISQRLMHAFHIKFHSVKNALKVMSQINHSKGWTHCSQL